MVEELLSLKDVRAGYGRTEILNGISFDVRKGERLAVIGRNGVGKTTLLATIMGLTRLHGGAISHAGERIDALPTHRRAERGLGLVPQTRDIFKSLTVEENIVAGLRGEGTLDQAYALFPRLKERRRNRGGQLSGGEQQMLAIARALAGRPSLLLLDEPLEGLAPVICDMLMDVFHRLASDGRTTVVLVEQHVEMAIDFADRVIILDAGQIVYQGLPADIHSDSSILSRFVGVALEPS
jgi:branched-chain amino acid transport system ATP-binding protein